MPLDLQIIRAREFVRIGAEGQFDLAISKLALAELARACHKRGIQRAMMDLSELHPGPKPVFSPADLADLLSTFLEIGFTKELCLAVVYSSDPHGRARMFSMISTMHGWQVRCFENFEQAMIWLSREKPEEDEQADAHQSAPVPIQHSPEEAPKKPQI